MEKVIEQIEEARKPYIQPKLVRQGRVEELTQDWEEYLDCSKPVQ